MQELQIDCELQDHALTTGLETFILPRLRDLGPPCGAKLRLQVTVSVLPIGAEPEPAAVLSGEVIAADPHPPEHHLALHAADDAGRRLFTAREREVMDLVVRGLTTKQAAQRLAISHRTVEVHRARAMQKAQAKNLAMFVLATMRRSV